jgi:hypothetical protein
VHFVSQKHSGYAEYLWEKITLYNKLNFWYFRTKRMVLPHEMHESAVGICNTERSQALP